MCQLFLNVSECGLFIHVDHIQVLGILSGDGDLHFMYWMTGGDDDVMDGWYIVL